MLLGVWFIIGLILAISGVFITASDYDLEIKDCSFDCEVLGTGLSIIGGLLAGAMLFALGVRWLSTPL